AGMLSPKELGHLGGIARWHGREAVEPELEQKKEAATKLGKELGHRGGVRRWYGKDGVGAEKEQPGDKDFIDDTESSAVEPEDEEYVPTGEEEDTEAVEGNRSRWVMRALTYLEPADELTDEEVEELVEEAKQIVGQDNEQLMEQGYSDGPAPHDRPGKGQPVRGMDAEDLQKAWSQEQFERHQKDESGQRTKRSAPASSTKKQPRGSQPKTSSESEAILIMKGDRPAEEGKPQKQIRTGGDDRGHQRQTAASSGAPPSTPRKGAAGQMSPQELGHLGGTARWYGREAAEQEMEQMGYESAPRRRTSSDAGGKRSSSVANRDPRAMAPEEASHVAGIARWYGRDAAEEEKKRMGYGELGRRSTRSRSPSPEGDDGRQLSPQQLGHLGGTGRWYGKEAVEKEKEKQRMRQDDKGDDERGYDRKDSGKVGGDSQISPKELGHLGGTARWYGREAADNEKEQMGLAGKPERQPKSSSGGKQLYAQEAGHHGGTGRFHGEEAAMEEKPEVGYDQPPQNTSEDSPPKRSSNSGRSARAMSPEEASHLGGIARWHGREAAEQEKKRLGYGDLGRKRSGSRSESQGGGSQLSPEQLGHLGGTGRWYGKEAVEAEKQKMGLADSSAPQGRRRAPQGDYPRGGESDDDTMEVEEQPANNQPRRGGEQRRYGSGQKDNTQMSQQERGHLGGTARWYGREAAEQEKDNMGMDGGRDSRKNNQGGPASAQHATSGQGGLGQLDAKELGHLGGKARWHGREAIEGELRQKRQEVDEGRRRR
ncbi:hypothetical protein AAVH_32844, partial [Aphelenchoides avenae]